MTPLDLTPLEMKCLASAGRLDLLPRRRRSAWTLSTAFFIVVAAMIYRGGSDELLSYTLLMYIPLVAWERHLYGRTLSAYHSLVRKLVAARA